MAIDAIYAICEADVTEVRSKEVKCALSKGNVDGKRTLEVVPCCTLVFGTLRSPKFSQ